MGAIGSPFQGRVRVQSGQKRLSAESKVHALGTFGDNRQGVVLRVELILINVLRSALKMLCAQAQAMVRETTQSSAQLGTWLSATGLFALTSPFQELPLRLSFDLSRAVEH